MFKRFLEYVKERIQNSYLQRKNETLTINKNRITRKIW